MKKRDEIKLEVLSRIDDNIIDRQTEKRFRLLIKGKYSRKKIIAWMSSAAALLLVCSLLFTVLLPVLLKQIPVYQGMTVSNTSPIAQTPSVAYGTGSTVQKTFLHASQMITASEGQEAPENPEEPETPEHIPDSPELLPEIVGTDRSLYYAKQNEDVYITIHIHNPENFEILSFTLNGVKYQSYMFEEGSDSERLVLKVNVGEAECMVYYTIDAIKYVDGTKIKDVRMDGEKTVWIAVYPNDQPKIKVQNLTVGNEQIEFDAALTDKHGLIVASEGAISAILMQNDRQIAEQTVSLDETTAVTFSSLTPGVEYQIRIVAKYDALDGNGFGTYVLFKKTVLTKPYIEIRNVSVDLTTVRFALSLLSPDVTVQKIELVNQKGSVTHSATEALDLFTEVSYGTYFLRITYTYGEDGKTGFAALDDPISVVYLFSDLNAIVAGGELGKEYSDIEQRYNATTQDYRYHYGIDIKHPTDPAAPVLAAFSGVIANVSNGQIELTSPDGRMTAIYGSLSSVAVTLGEAVTAGQILGCTGDTAEDERAEGPHVHFEIYIDGTRMDPIELLCEK